MHRWIDERGLRGMNDKVGKFRELKRSNGRLVGQKRTWEETFITSNRIGMEYSKSALQWHGPVTSCKITGWIKDHPNWRGSHSETVTRCPKVALYQYFTFYSARPLSPSNTECPSWANTSPCRTNVRAFVLKLGTVSSAGAEDGIRRRNWDQYKCDKGNWDGERSTGVNLLLNLVKWESIWIFSIRNWSELEKWHGIINRIRTFLINTFRIAGSE